MPEYGVQKFLYGTGALLALLIVIGLALPRYSRVEVRAPVDAHPATVFALVNDFRRVNLWAPRNAGDPNARVIYSGPPRGVGATVSWDGPVIGSGTQQITASRRYEFVETLINPGEPGEAKTRFDIAREGSGSAVTWAFEHDHGFNLVGRYFSLLLTGVLRREYENGIAALRDFAESLPRTDFGDLEIEHVFVEPNQIAYLEATSIPEPTAISEAMGKAYFEILSFIDEQGLTNAGPPMSIARSFSGAELRFDAAIPVRGISDTTSVDGRAVRLGTTYTGPAIRATHTGSYRTLGVTHRKIASYLAAFGIERNGDAWEVYVSDPTKVSDRELQTAVYYPVRER